MRLEAKLIPVREKGGWTPYSIRVLPDGKVRVALTGTYRVVDFTQKEIPLTLPNTEGSFLLTQNAVDQNRYDVAGLGVLKIYDDACTYTTKNGKSEYTARIPSMDRRDAVCTGMAYFGISMRTSGGGT